MQDCLQDARRIVVAFPSHPLNRPEQSAESVPWIAIVSHPQWDDNGTAMCTVTVTSPLDFFGDHVARTSSSRKQHDQEVTSVDASFDFISPSCAEWDACVYKNRVAVCYQFIVKPRGKCSFLSFGMGIRDEKFSGLHVGINPASDESRIVSHYFYPNNSSTTIRHPGTAGSASAMSPRR